VTHYRRWTLPLLFACLLVWGVATLWMRERWPRGVLEVGLYALAAWFLLRGRLRWDWRAGLLALAAGWGIVQMLAGWTVYPHATLEAALFWAAAAAAYLVAFQVFGDAGRAARFRHGMAWFGMGLAALAVVQLYTSQGRVYWIFDSGYSDNVLGPFVYRNNYAAFMELLLPLALVEAFSGRPRSFWFQAGAALMVASVVASGSRAGSLIITVEVVIVGALCWRRNRSGVTVFRLVALTAVLTAVAGWAFLWARFQDDDPLAGRREYLAASIEMVRQRPWTGFGLGTWPNVYPAFARVEDGLFANRAHNNWAEWAVEGGIPFVAVFVLLVAGSLRRAWNSVWGLGLAPVCIHALVDYPFARLGQAVWWFALLALTGSLPGPRSGPTVRSGERGPERRSSGCWRSSIPGLPCGAPIRTFTAF
jgi:O-antigen ligase